MKLLGIFAVLATLATGSITVAPSSARSWIDDPLPGSILPVAPVEVVAHAFDDAGVVTFVFSVDGVLVDEIAPAGAGDRFVTVRVQWNPPGPGTYLLQVQGRTADQTTGAAATAVIRIREGEVPEATTTSTTISTSTTIAATTTTTTPPTTSTTVAATTTTTTPTTTSTTTSTEPPATTTTVAATTTAPPCTIGTPNPTAPPNGSATNSTVTLQWSYNGCDPAAFTIQVSLARDFSTIESGGTVTGTQRSWITIIRCGFDYYWRVRAEDVDAGPWSSTSTFTTSTRTCA